MTLQTKNFDFLHEKHFDTVPRAEAGKPESTCNKTNIATN